MKKLRKRPLFKINKPTISLGTWYKANCDKIIVFITWADSYDDRVDAYIDLSQDGGATIYKTYHTGVAKIGNVVNDYSYVLA